MLLIVQLLGLGKGGDGWLDGYKRIKDTKIHVVVSCEALRLNIQTDPDD
ncbi:MAG: hypothetical protein QXP91_04935 [Candidatus Methanomethylicia archaeon]